MKIALFFNDPGGHGHLAHYCRRKFTQLGIPFDHFWTRDAQKVPRTYDLYLRFDHGDYQDDLPIDMHPSVFYAIDTHLKKPYKKIKEQAKHYDIVFCAQWPGMERLRRDTKTDVQWVPIGSDPDVFRKLDVPKKYDIGFVGRNAEKFDRGRHLKLIREKYPNSFIGEAPQNKISEIYSAAKIGFNSSIADDLNMRMFEIPFCGCFLLTNRIKNKGVTQIFEEGKDFVTYTDTRDLVKKIDYYLKHEEEREAIARNGHAKVQQYTYL